MLAPERVWVDAGGAIWPELPLWAFCEGVWGMATAAGMAVPASRLPAPPIIESTTHLLGGVSGWLAGGLTSQWRGLWLP